MMERGGTEELDFPRTLVGPVMERGKLFTAGAF